MGFLIPPSSGYGQPSPPYGSPEVMQSVLESKGFQIKPLSDRLQRVPTQPLTPNSLVNRLRQKDDGTYIVPLLILDGGQHLNHMQEEARSYLQQKLVNTGVKADIQFTTIAMGGDGSGFDEAVHKAITQYPLNQFAGVIMANTPDSKLNDIIERYHLPSATQWGDLGRFQSQLRQIELSNAPVKKGAHVLGETGKRARTLKELNTLAHQLPVLDAVGNNGSSSPATVLNLNVVRIGAATSETDPTIAPVTTKVPMDMVIDGHDKNGSNTTSMADAHGAGALAELLVKTRVYYDHLRQQIPSQDINP